MSEGHESKDASTPPSDPLPSIFLSVSPYDDELEIRLKTHDFAYFLKQARYLCSDVSDDDLQDIADEAWIAYARNATKTTIEKPGAYIKQIIQSKFMDYLRKKRRRDSIPMLSLSAYEDRPDMDIPANRGESLVDPANEVEEILSLTALYQELAHALPALPPRQRWAMSCTALDGAPDPQSLRQLLKENHIDIAEMSWPENKDEKRLLQASLPAARHNLANLMHTDLSQYQQRKRRQEKIA